MQVTYAFAPRCAAQGAAVGARASSGNFALLQPPLLSCSRQRTHVSRSPRSHFAIVKPELGVLQKPIEASKGSQQELVDTNIRALLSYKSPESSIDPGCEAAAVQAATIIQQVVKTAVDSKSGGLRGLQSAVTSTGALVPLISLAEAGHAIAYEALQILCYRNSVTAQQIAAAGIVERIGASLTSLADLELQCAMCFLLTGMVAFSDATHEVVIAGGLVPQLVMLCRVKSENTAVETSKRVSSLQNRAAAVLRNLAHNTKNHGLLISAGAVDAMVDVLKKEKDPATRINAAVAVACLVGHEEGNPRLQLEEDLVGDMLLVLEAACSGVMRHGTFWTCWKLCQGLASLTVNDRNKELITARSGIKILAEVLFGKHHNNEAAHRFALSALWNLAFIDSSRKAILNMPGLVEAIRNTLATTESTRTKEVAKGCLWTLGLEQDVKSLHEGSGRVAVTGDHSGAGESGRLDAEEQHVMLSYEWGCQQSVMLIKTELQRAGYRTWMDIDKMSGSTLEAMARAVEDSAVVLVCVSKRYKESQACRTEAEYAFQQRKKIIPILLERDYKPSGWLGALMGTRLYFSLHDPRQISSKIPGLIKELGDNGRQNPSGEQGQQGSSGQGAMSIKLSGTSPESWTHADVEEWLKRIRCPEYVGSFREKDMDGMALSGLYRMCSDPRYVHDILVLEFGMSSLGQRLRLLEELNRLYA